MSNLLSALPYYHKFLEECDILCNQKGLAPSTAMNKRTALKTIFIEVPKLTRLAFLTWLDSFVSKRTGRPLGPHGKNRYIKALNWYLARTHLIPEAKKISEFLNIECFSPPPSPGRALSSDEFEEIIQFSPDNAHELAFRLMYESGFRPHELLSLRVSDTHEEERNSVGIARKEFGSDVDKEPTPEEKRNYDTISISRLVMVRIPEENPVTPSLRNKTGKRSVIVQINARELLKLAEERQILAGPNALLFPYPHKHFSREFSQMKKLHYNLFFCI